MHERNAQRLNPITNSANFQLDYGILLYSTLHIKKAVGRQILMIGLGSGSRPEFMVN